MTKFLDLRKTCAKVICRVILPSLTIFFVLIMPSFMVYQFTQNLIFDWLVRIGLTVYFCINYWQLPELFDPKSGRWLAVSRSILLDPILLKGYYLFLTAVYSLAAAAFTLFAFSIFLPTFQSYRFLAAGINGLIFLIAFIFRYKAFMQLAASQKP